MSNKKSNVKFLLSYFFIAIILCVLLVNMIFLTSGCGKGVPKNSTTSTSTTTSSTGTTTSTSTTTTTTVLTIVATPTFSPSAGNFDASRETISISTTTPGATIYYTIGTTDAGSPTTGSVPSTNAITYEAPISITSSKHIRAVALRSDLNNSDEGAGDFNLYWWQAAGLNALNAPVKTICNFGGDIFIGGGFINASGNANADYTAHFNSANSTWEALNATVLDGTVEVITGGDGDIFFGGHFAHFGATSANNALRLSIHTYAFSSLTGGQPDNIVKAMAFDQTSKRMFIGGDYTHVGATAANRIASYHQDLNTWGVMGSGLTMYVLSVALNTSNEVYVGGGFTNYITEWNGSAFSTVGSDSLESAVGALKYYSATPPYLIVGGAFQNIGTTSYKRIAKYTPSTGLWSAYGDGFDGQVNVLAIDNNTSNVLYAGGAFQNSGTGGTALNRIAKWNDTAWVPLGNGLNGTVYAITSDNLGNIFIGGDFTDGGGISGANYIVKWGKLN